MTEPCINCGYQLAGLPEHGACPECSAPLSWNRREYEALGLQRKKKIPIGLNALIACMGILIGLALWITVTHGTTFSFEKMDCTLSLKTRLVCAGIICFVEMLAYSGYSYLTTVRGPAREQRLRLALSKTMKVQTMLMASVGIWLFALYGVFGVGYWLPAIIVAAYFVAWIVRFVIASKLLRQLALTLEDTRTAALCNQLIWQMPTLGVIGLYVPLVLAIACGMHIRVLWRILLAARRKDSKWNWFSNRT